MRLGLSATFWATVAGRAGRYASASGTRPTLCAPWVCDMLFSNSSWKAVVRFAVKLASLSLPMRSLM
jgi:hypothetical protein